MKRTLFKEATEVFTRDDVSLFMGDSLQLCASWPSPTVIIVDGPYGIGSFPGDPPTPKELDQWYFPHIQAWSSRATPETSLWFWNTELGWANVHPVFLKHDWEYRSCHVWDKGIAHIAGNSNGLTLRKFPVVTEVCVHYVRKADFQINGYKLDMKDWLRHEWFRTGLPLYKANEACGVKNAATRKYLTDDHLWYYPPADAFEKLAQYANKNGKKSGRPYFSLDGKRPLTCYEWARMRSKFNFENHVTNVWREPSVRGSERLKERSKCVHINQKPLRLLELIIRATSDPGDVVWEPFGGLCSVAIASHKLKRKCFSAEILPQYFEFACRRLAKYENAQT